MPYKNRGKGIRRRLIVFSPNRILKTRNGPKTHKDGLEAKLDQPDWSPEYCFFSASSNENPMKQTWEEITKVIPKLVESCTVKEFKPGFHMSRSIFEATFAKHLYSIGKKCRTIMVMTIFTPTHFQEFIATLVGKQVEFTKGPFIAMLESRERGDGWSEDQSLDLNSWNLFNEDEIKVQNSVREASPSEDDSEHDHTRQREQRVPRSKGADRRLKRIVKFEREKMFQGRRMQRFADDVESHDGKSEGHQPRPPKLNDFLPPLGKPEDRQSRPQSLTTENRTTGPESRTWAGIVGDSIPRKADDVQSHLRKADDVQSPLGKPDDVQSPLGKPDDVQSPLGKPDDVRSPLGKPDDVQSPLGKADDVQSPLGKPDDFQSPLGKPDDVQSPLGKPDDLQSPLGKPDDLQSPLGKPDDFQSPLGKPDDVQSPLGEPDDKDGRHLGTRNRNGLESPVAKSHVGKPDNAKEWAEALDEHDCKRLKDLLEAWEEQRNIEAEDGDRVGKLQFEKLFKGNYENLKEGSQEGGDTLPLPILLGSTALHAAARRGDLELLKLIVDEILHRDEECSIHCNVLKVIHKDYRLDALAMALANGNQKIIEFLIKTSRECSYNPYDIRFATDNDSIPDGNDGESTVEQLKALHEKNGEGMARLSRELVPCGKDEETTAGLVSTVKMDQPEDELKKITNELLEKSSSLARALYYRDKDFNFLDISMYFFHFSFSIWDKEYSDTIVSIKRGIFSKMSQGFERKVFLHYLLVDLKDGQGRTPLHVAVDSNKVKEFCNNMHSARKLAQDKDEGLDKLITDILNAKDGGGRTPLYRAVAKNQKDAVKDLLEEDRVNVNARVSYTANQWGMGLDVDQLSRRNNFHSDCFYIAEKQRNKLYKESSTRGRRDQPNLQPPEVSYSALHVAIILKHKEIVEAIVSELLSPGHNNSSDDIWCHRRFRRPRVAGKGDISIHESRISTMKLAVLVESISILRTLLEAEDKKPGLFTSEEDEENFPSFHLAAAVGNVGVVKAFLDSKHGNFDPTKVDCFQNTALHHAVTGHYGRFYPHLVDFVGCDYVLDWDEVQPRGTTETQRVVVQQDETAKLSDVQRKLSINLLLQVGINISEKNDSNMTAHPEPNALDEFTQWWYEKATQEVQRAQKKLNAAANAISVTAALVATASYLGPLQPPLGYDTNSIQENILAVRIYVVCNSLSFYLALGAIMLALLPALPLPQESVFRDLARTRILVAAAVTFLFPSIVCVLLAFASGYIAVIADHGLAYHGYLLATTAVGCLLCFLVMIAFLHRLTRVIITLPRDVWKEIGLNTSVQALVGVFSWVSGSSNRSQGGRFQAGFPVLPQDQLQLLALK